MQEIILTNSYNSLKSKKIKSKEDSKSTSTNKDSKSQKHDSNSNSDSKNKPNYSNLSLCKMQNQLNKFETPENLKTRFIYLPINELKQFKAWNSSNLNAIYQNILTNEQKNNLYLQPKFSNHLDITDIHRTILVDWLINVHLYFKLSDECLYLSIKLIDIFLARTTNFTKNRLQLLGICSLQLSSKYLEQIHPSISNLSDLCDKCYKKKEIIQFEKCLLKINNYIIEQNEILNYYDLLCLILKFNIKYYYFGKMLLDLTLLDINFYKYQINTIIFSVCSLVIYNSKFIDSLEDDFELYIQENKYKTLVSSINESSGQISYNSSSNDDLQSTNRINYLFSFYPYKDYSLIFKCNREIVDLYERIKTSKYNSAIQKYFIQIKEKKESLFLQQQNDGVFEIIEFSRFENEDTIKKADNEDDNIDMIILD